MNSSKIAFNLRKRIGRFSGNVSKRLCLPAQHFVGDMVYGIQASQSVMLSEVGRALEEDIAMIKTEERLSRNLQRPDLEDTVQDNVMAMAAGHIGQDTLLLAVMFFAACILDHDQRLRIMAQYVEKAAKRIFGIPDFKYYALSDGLRSLFSRHPGKPHRAARSPGTQQMELILN